MVIYNLEIQIVETLCEYTHTLLEYTIYLILEYSCRTQQDTIFEDNTGVHAANSRSFTSKLPAIVK